MQHNACATLEKLPTSPFFSFLNCKMSIEVIIIPLS